MAEKKQEQVPAEHTDTSAEAQEDNSPDRPDCKQEDKDNSPCPDKAAAYPCPNPCRHLCP